MSYAYTVLYRNKMFDDMHSTVIGVFTSLENARSVSISFLQKEKEYDTEVTQNDDGTLMGCIQIVVSPVDGISPQIIFSWGVSEFFEDTLISKIHDHYSKILEEY